MSGISCWQYTGRIRIHFNRKEEAPLFASITPAGYPAVRPWEVLAQSVKLHGWVAETFHNLEGRQGLDPIWWLEGLATVKLGSDGVAHVYPGG